MGEKWRLHGRGRGGWGALKGEKIAAEIAGPFKRPGWLCGDST